MTKRQIKKILESLDFLILAIRARGGYKYREKLHLSDVEIGKYLARSERDLKATVISLMVAEEMLQEIGSSFNKARWDEYQERREEAMKAVKGWHPLISIPKPGQIQDMVGSGRL